MTDRDFTAEEVDSAIEEMELMLCEAAPSPTRLTALAALSGVRERLGLPIPARVRESLRRAPTRERVRTPRRFDGELSD